MNNNRIVMVIRKDLDLSIGLAMAQATHVGMEWMRSFMEGVLGSSGGFQVTELQLDWIKSPTLSVLSVNTPEELQLIKTEAATLNVPVHVWKDTIYSAVLNKHMEGITVGISIGPVEDDIVKTVTGRLPLYI